MDVWNASHRPACRAAPSGAKGRPGAGQGGGLEMLLCKMESRHGLRPPDRQHLLPAHRPDKSRACARLPVSRADRLLRGSDSSYQCEHSGYPLKLMIPCWPGEGDSGSTHDLSASFEAFFLL